jgi:dihydropteroate synthase
MKFACGAYLLNLSRPHVMGIVNVTPDSFSDGGQHASRDAAVSHAMRLIEQGADILDIGGESTRPGAEPVSLQEELARVIPVIKALRPMVNVPISIDTYKPEVMRQAIETGADIVNDVRALREAGALEVVAASNAGVCLMHMRGTPQTMQQDPVYDDVVGEVSCFLSARYEAALNAGISKSRIVLDPGFGFGKRTVHNIALLQQLDKLAELGQPLLVGLSRKSILGAITGKHEHERLYASLAAAVIAAMKGARILRVHDVQATADALKVVSAIQP